MFTIKDDSRREYAEGFMPYLKLDGIERITTPQPDGRVMSSAAVGTYIRASDQQPDALASNSASTGYVGAGIYNTTAHRQTVTKSARRGTARNSYFRVCNDVYSANRFVLRANRVTGGVSARFFRGTRDISKALRSTAGYPVRVRVSKCVKLRVRFNIRARATVGAIRAAKLSVRWSGDVVTRDAARARVRVR